MSVIIKSNNQATSHFGQLKSLNTTAQAEFDKYKARVLADGGVINNEAKTLEAFQILISSNAYGNCNTFVGGSFGVKLSGSGVSKLYSLDGHDLVAKQYNGAPLATIDSSNAINFESNSANSGVIYSTEHPVILSKNNKIAMGIMLKKGAETTVPSTVKPLVGYTKHITQTMESILTFNVTTASSYFRYVTDKKIDVLNAYYEHLTNSAFISLIADKSAKNFEVYRANEGKITSRTGDLYELPDLTDTSFYIDFGGIDTGDTKVFYSGRTMAFYSLSNATTAMLKSLHNMSL